MKEGKAPGPDNFQTEFLKLMDYGWDQMVNQDIQPDIQAVFESCAEILTTSYWLYVELGKNIEKILCQKIK
jgi:hypothetical protein